MAEESTPLPGACAEDTSAVLENADTSLSEPAEAAEPEAQNGEAETEASGGGPAADGQETGANGEDTAEKLIFGKYKSLEDAEKGYKEAEKAITRSAELEKRLKAYQEREEQESRVRQDAARKLGFNDAEEQQLDWEIKNFEFARCVEALGATLEGDAYEKAYNALARYRATLNPRDLAAAKACFAPETIAEIAGQVALYRNQAAGEYQNRVQTQRLAEVKTRVAAFAKETGDWLNPKERQDIVGMAVNLTGGDVDLNKVRELVDAVEAYAVKRYQEKTKIEAENQQLQGSLQAPASGGIPPAGEKWITREEYNRMSEEQFEANRDKIERQILLERQGKLRPMLT